MHARRIKHDRSTHPSQWLGKNAASDISKKTSVLTSDCCHRFCPQSFQTVLTASSAQPQINTASVQKARSCNSCYAQKQSVTSRHAGSCWIHILQTPACLLPAFQPHPILIYHSWNIKKNTRLSLFTYLQLDFLELLEVMSGPFGDCYARFLQARCLWPN